MSRRAAFAAAVLAVLGVVYGLAVMSAGAPVDEADLRARVQGSMPTWESYQEDIKGQLGARPAAEWRGDLQSARIGSDGALEALFRIEGPWADRSPGMPILLRDPELRVSRSADVRREGGMHVYRFPAPDGAPPPWVEIQFPHRTRRVGLEPTG